MHTYACVVYICLEVLIRLQRIYIKHNYIYQKGITFYTL